MNIKESISNIKSMLNSLPNGPQREYYEDIVNRLEKGEAINPSDFINGMDKEAFSNINIDALKEKEQQAKKIFEQWVSK